MYRSEVVTDCKHNLHIMLQVTDDNYTFKKLRNRLYSESNIVLILSTFFIISLKLNVCTGCLLRGIRDDAYAMRD